MCNEKVENAEIGVLHAIANEAISHVLFCMQINFPFEDYPFPHKLHRVLVDNNLAKELVK
jgi:hypothetical protein